MDGSWRRARGIRYTPLIICAPVPFFPAPARAPAHHSLRIQFVYHFVDHLLDRTQTRLLRYVIAHADGDRRLNLYTDIDRFCCTWLTTLIEHQQLPPGTVVCAPIQDLQLPALTLERERTPSNQVHFFCGIGGWPLALELAHWPTTTRTYTGSCPCQPFSKMGKGQAFDDNRHLWPTYLHAITVGRPTAVFGEQVAVGAGRPWFARVRADLEALGYLVGAASLPAAAVGAPHARERLFFGAWLADAECPRLEGYAGDGDREQEPRWQPPPSPGSASAGSCDSPWSDSQWIECGDGHRRRIERGLLPLASRVPAYVGRVRAYGNSIVPPLAAVFIRAFALALTDMRSHNRS